MSEFSVIQWLFYIHTFSQGIMGFSQGGALATLVAGLVRKISA